MEFLPGNFVWDNNSHEKYTKDISSPQAISKLANCMADVDTGGTFCITDINRDFCSFASHESGFESHRAYLGHVRPSYACSGTSCAKHSSVGSSIASGMAAAITTGQGLHPVLNFEQ
jgi:hypothetical protein